MILHHNCQQCGHPDYFHARDVCSYGWCKCQVATATMTAMPVASPTWLPNGQPVLTITPPGTKFPTQGQGHITCTCDSCGVEFARLSGDVA